MGRFRLEVPLAIQIGAVVVLFAAALGTLWYTSSAVVEREERRARANDRLKEASDQLEARGKDALAAVRQFPDFMEVGDWSALDRRLSEEAGRIRGRHPGIEGGYYVPSRPEQPYLPALPNEPRQSEAREGSRLPVSPPSPPRRNLYDYVDTQVDAAYRKRNELSVVEDIPPYTIAIRTAPVRVNGRVVAATWTMTRLVDPIYIDQSARGYRWFAGLALAGIALSLVLTVRLARTVRRQAAERERLRTELRRSERLAALGKLIAGVAHEVRNPLAGIRGITQLWRRGLGLGNEGFDHLIDEVDRLEGIVSRLLQFSRADAQDLTPGDLNIVAAEAARLAAGPRRGEQEIRVELDLEPDLPPIADGPAGLGAGLPQPDDQRLAGHAARRGAPAGDPPRRGTRHRCGERCRRRAGPLGRGPVAPVRTILHHQGRGNRAGPGDRSRDRAGPPGRAPCRRTAPADGAVFTLTLPVAEVAAPRGEPR